MESVTMKSKKMSLMVLFAFLSLLLFGKMTVNAMEVSGKTYYVDAEMGDDSASGLEPLKAWKTLDKVNSTVFQPGDQILFKAGDTWEGQLWPKGSGNAENSIIIDRYGEGKDPYIKGNVEKGAAVYLFNQQYWEINHLEITNTSHVKADRQGICFENQDAGVLKHIYVKNCNVHDVTGIEITTGVGSSKCNGGIIGKITTKNPTTGEGAIQSKWEDVLIDGNSVKNLGREGIYFYSYWSVRWGLEEPNAGIYYPSEQVVVRNNTVDNVDGDGIVITCCDGAVVEHNFVRGANSRPNGKYHAGVWMWSSDNCIFRYNEVCETKTTFDGMAFDFDNCTTGNIYEYNYSHDNEGGFMLLCSSNKCSNNIVRYNLSVNDGCVSNSQVIMMYGTNTSNVSFYNNTFVYGDTMFVRQAHKNSGDNASDISFKNNIIYKLAGKEELETLGCTYDYNNYYGIQSPVMDKHAIIENPMFVGEGGTIENYKLQDHSPCIDAGTVIEENGGTDYWGNILYNGSPDIGFEEHGKKAENIVTEAMINTNFYNDEAIRLKDGIYNTVNGTELWTTWEENIPLGGNGGIVSLKWNEKHIFDEITLYHYTDTISAFPEEVSFGYIDASAQERGVGYVSSEPKEVISINGKKLFEVTYKFSERIESDNVKIELKTAKEGMNSVGLSEIIILEAQ